MKNKNKIIKQFIIGFYVTGDKIKICSEIGRSEISLTEKSYYSDIKSALALIDKVYSCYWQTAPLNLNFAYIAENSTEMRIFFDNEQVNKWFKLLCNYQAITDDITYSPLTMWRLKVNMWVAMKKQIKLLKNKN